MSWLGLDVGGANLKAADGAGWARSVLFALWREPQNLATELKTLIDSGPPADRLAVTMTGELCDCFRNKAEGVRHILAAVDQAAAGREVWVYQVDGRFVAAAEAANHPRLAAASNWHALGAFAGRYAPHGAAILIDVGSTTTDVIPLVDGRVVARGTDDLERLACGELLYRGVRRTPLCALCQTLPWNGRDCPVAAEMFATTADAYVVLGMIDEELAAGWTADGKPLTKDHARQRLARQLCADASELGTDAIDEIARAVRDTQVAELRRSIGTVAERLPGTASTFILSGSGEFVARAALEHKAGVLYLYLSLQAEIGGRASECAPAHAVAVLARERENMGDLRGSR
jgi:(4-(4-[2-(gamma-L-glutamylamino)ethyl]phenoxymethyl)furan-2-yl)methanamine synthase